MARHMTAKDNLGFYDIYRKGLFGWYYIYEYGNDKAMAEEMIKNYEKFGIYTTDANEYKGTPK